MSLLLSTGAFASSLSGAAPGMVLLTPTSITHSGTSASIGANGQVTFTAVDSLSLNGVFSADFDNYVVSVRLTGVASGSGNTRNLVQMRSSGTTATGSDYTYQSLVASSTSVTAARASTQSFWEIAYSYEGGFSGWMLQLYGPALVQPTAVRSVTPSIRGDIEIRDYAGTHSLSTSYDGITLAWTGLEYQTGALQVYGVRS